MSLEKPTLDERCSLTNQVGDLENRDAAVAAIARKGLLNDKRAPSGTGRAIDEQHEAPRR